VGGRMSGWKKRIVEYYAFHFIIKVVNVMSESFGWKTTDLYFTFKQV